jgi:hypothetical protein
MPVKRCMIANILINSLCLLDVGLSGFLALPCLACECGNAGIEYERYASVHEDCVPYPPGTPWQLTVGESIEDLSRRTG